jgi:outer membrane murein-binding lipoprotein Lpp
MNLLIAVLSVEHAEVYEDIDKEFAITRTAATLRMREKVEEHTLPPPLNLLQLPSTGWSWLHGRGLVGGTLGRRTARLCWLLLAQPVPIVLEMLVGLLVCVAMGLQVGEMQFVKTKDRQKLGEIPLLGRLDPEGRYFAPLFGLVFIVLGPVLVLLVLIPAVIFWLQLVVRLLLGFEDVGCLTFDAQRSVSAADADALRRKHWPDKDWADLISAVVGEVFSTAEVDDGTANPLRLNSEGRMRWLCERTLQSARNDAAIVEKVALMESQHAQSSAKLDEMKTDVDDLKADVDEKLEKMNEQLERIATMLAMHAGGGAGS